MGIAVLFWEETPVHLCWEFALVFVTESPYIRTIEFVIFLSTESEPASQEKAFHGKNLKGPHEAIKCDPRAHKSLNYSVCGSQLMLFWGLIFLAPLQKITSMRIRSETVSGILVPSFPNTNFPHFKCKTTEKEKRWREMHQFNIFFLIYIWLTMSQKKKKR